MKLLRVEIAHFACIRKADVALGPGLNVLYGPNDLGKSTFARAIRAALLIQHSSNVASDFVEWESDERPSVHVTFETPDRRIWRVEKRYGTPGASVLLESNDGVSFSAWKKAREVDDELRTMLGWGIASPATKGAPRGLPVSFLATVLLGEQADVAGVLRQSLEADSDESGRVRITAALEAFAQDPLFKSILDAAQSKVDEAFTAKGLPKRGKSSPFREVTEEVKRVKEQLELLERRVGESESARRQLEASRIEHDRCASRRDEALERREAVRVAMAALEARRAVESELAAARTELEKNEAELFALAEREARLGELERKLAALREDKAALAAEHLAALAHRASAEEALRRAQSDEAERERERAQASLEKRRLELDAQASDLRTALDRARKARHAEAHLEEAERRRAELEEGRAGLDARAAEAKTREELFAHRLEVLEVAARIAERRRRALEIEALDAVRAEVEADRATAIERREQAEAMGRELDLRLPGAGELAAMRALAHELEIAEAKLGGGLSVTIERLKPVAIDAVFDGLDASVPDTDVVSLEASRSMEIRIAGVANVMVSAGERDARTDVERLRRRWAEEVAPLVSSSSSPSLDALAERVGARVALERSIDTEREAAAALDQRAALRAQQLDKLERLREELALLDRELEGVAQHEAALVLDELDELGSRPLAERRTELRRERDHAAKVARDAIESVRERNTELSVMAERVESARRSVHELGVARPDGGWDAEDARLDEAARSLDEERTRVDAELAALSAAREAEMEGAEALLRAAIDALDAVAAELERVAMRAEHEQSAASHLAGDIAARRESTARLDIEGARARVAEASARSAILPPARDVDDAERAAVDRELEEAERAHQHAQDEVRKAEGALQTVGGQVVREEEQATRDALQRAEQKERDVELEYQAWRLLTDSLRAAENMEGVHLGEALSKPVTERFGRLTANRYGKLELAPDLRAEGVRAAGALRELASLSAGTQEQLATLLRLTIAEHLGSALVLDDHLTQTDPARSAWFREVLREHAAQAQIVVLTCRPLDYLRDADLPESGQPRATRAAGLVHAIDLSLLIQRGGA